jgi:type VI secretion system protein ImpL
LNAPGWLKNRWLLGGLAFFAFSVAAWLIGDLVVLGGWRPFESAAGRVVLIALAAAGWIGWELWRARLARLENEHLLEVIAGGGDAVAPDGLDSADSAARAAREIALLRQRFEEAAAFLKKARFKGPDGENRYVSELPWYVFIGSPGSGKTTALVNAGLNFPLRGPGGDPALAGVGGTRNCDWWFTDEAVLLDTAGRYTTQESDLEADAAAWQGFLGLIKRFRPRRPLNGALVTLSMSDLMLWNDEERQRYAYHVRARIAELYERLGVRFPVYLLVTKTDLLAGFMEFFGELDAEGRRRVWGATFDFIGDRFVTGTPGQRFEVEFEELERRLYDEMLARLQDEPDLQRRAAAYRFPQEFHGVGTLIGRFLDAAFLGVQGAPEPLLRGVYFTSGTQEGNPIDRVLGTLARSFKLERAAGPAVAAGSGKSFFLSRVVREVIFPESGLASSDEGFERRERRARTFGLAAIAGLSVVLASIWAVVYADNRGLIVDAEAKTAMAKAELDKLGSLRAGDEGQLVRLLNVLRDLPGGYREQQRGAASAGFGLSQAGKLGAQAARAYRNALGALSPRLRALDASAKLLAAANPDASQIAAAAAGPWRLTDAERADLAGHLRAGLELGALGMHQSR